MKKLLLLLLCVPLIFSCGEKKTDEGLSACDCADYAMKVFEFREKGETELRNELEEKYKHLTYEEKIWGKKDREGSYRTQRACLFGGVRELKEKLEKEFTICKDLSDESQNFYDDLNDCFLDKINKFEKSNGDLDSLTNRGNLVKYKRPNKILDSYLEIIKKKDNSGNQRGEETLQIEKIIQKEEKLQTGDTTYADGGKYVGEFKDGLKHGQGTYTFTNGDKYVGEYIDEKRNGKGTFTSTKGDKYVGDFLDGLFNGQGIYTWGEGNNKGDKYVGEWKDGKHNGQGTYTWGEGDNKGDKYVGEFINNQKTGQGTCTYANGEKYVGEWKDGKSHGKGVFTLADGRIIEGLFEDGQHKSILSGEYNDGGTTIDFDNGEKYIVE